MIPTCLSQKTSFLSYTNCFSTVSPPARPSCNRSPPGLFTEPSEPITRRRSSQPHFRASVLTPTTLVTKAKERMVTMTTMATMTTTLSGRFAWSAHGFLLLVRERVRFQGTSCCKPFCHHCFCVCKIELTSSLASRWSLSKSVSIEWVLPGSNSLQRTPSASSNVFQRRADPRTPVYKKIFLQQVTSPSPLSNAIHNNLTFRPAQDLVHLLPALMSPHVSALIESSLTVLSSSTAKPNVRGEALQLLVRMCDGGLLADARLITQPLASAKCSLLQQITVLCLESQFRVASASLLLVGKL
jgi:hypothetical protein